MNPRIVRTLHPAPPSPLSLRHALNSRTVAGPRISPRPPLICGAGTQRVTACRSEPPMIVRACVRPRPWRHAGDAARPTPDPTPVVVVPGEVGRRPADCVVLSRFNAVAGLSTPARSRVGLVAESDHRWCR